MNDYSSLRRLVVLTSKTDPTHLVFVPVPWGPRDKVDLAPFSAPFQCPCGLLLEVTASVSGGTTEYDPRCMFKFMNPPKHDDKGWG